MSNPTRNNFWQQTVCRGCGTTTDEHGQWCDGGGWATRKELHTEQIAGRHLAGEHIGASDLTRSNCANCKQYGPTGAMAVCEECGAGYVRVDLVDTDPDNVHGFKWLCATCQRRT